MADKCECPACDRHGIGDPCLTCVVSDGGRSCAWCRHGDDMDGSCLYEQEDECDEW